MRTAIKNMSITQLREILNKPRKNPLSIAQRQKIETLIFTQMTDNNQLLNKIDLNHPDRPLFKLAIKQLQKENKIKYYSVFEHAKVGEIDFCEFLLKLDKITRYMADSQQNKGKKYGRNYK